MRNLTGINKGSQSFWNPWREIHCSTSSFVWVGGILFFLAISGLGGCSSTPKSNSDPSKQEVQSDSDRFFKHLEKEEGKKDAKDAQP